jgi:glycosyltransferase involved in cell wall biosynthesis
MKILFIHSLYAPYTRGGAELTLQTLTEGLAARGIDVAVLTTTDQPGLHQDEMNGVRVWRAGLRNIYWHFSDERAAFFNRLIWHSLDSYNPLMERYVRRVVEIENPDVASSHNLPGWSISALATLTAKTIPTIQVLHDHYLACPASTMFKNGHNCKQQCASCRLMRLPHPRLSRRLNGVVGTSHYILERYRALGYFRNVPIQRVIYNARSQEPSKPSIPKTRCVFRFGFIGALTLGKGIEWLLRVFTEEAIPGTELLIAGRGHTGYEDKLKRCYAGNAIRFLGHTRPSGFFPEVDVVIVPSLWNDLLPGVVFEAFSYSRPVIGSRRGGIPEMIQHDVNGFLVEPDHPRELIQAMRYLSVNPSLAARMGKAARMSAAPFMDMERFLGEYMAVYKAAMMY